MKASLRADLASLAKLAFHRKEWGADLLRRIHRLSRRSQSVADGADLQLLRAWLLSPITLWPIHLEEFGQHLVEQLERGCALDDHTKLLLELLGAAPDATASAVTMQHEHAIQPGNYGSLIHAQHKFDLMEQALQADPEFREDWRRFKAQFAVKQFRDRKGVLRRRMLPERNYRTDWHFDWGTEREKFQTVFDVFCWRWHLYGMRHDEPLLMKLTVNLTPYGTMIFIPAYWSFDPKRDLKWQSITLLHKARGVRKQGPKLALNQTGQREDAERAAEFVRTATAAGLKGKQRTRAVMEQMGWHRNTDESKLRRLLKRAPITKTNHHP